MIPVGFWEVFCRRYRRALGGLKLLGFGCLFGLLGSLACGPAIFPSPHPAASCIQDIDCPQNYLCFGGICLRGKLPERSSDERSNHERNGERSGEFPAPERPADAKTDGPAAPDASEPIAKPEKPPETAPEGPPLDRPVCTPTGPEVCDDKDNDCNGKVDDSLSRECKSQCGPGKEICERGKWVKCIGEKGSAEICDGKDNDCDGSVDEEFPEKDKPCKLTSLMGVCAVGASRCSSGQLRCQQITQAGAEVCNGLDDDCDGSIDESIPSKACKPTAINVFGITCPTGTSVCRAGKEVCLVAPALSRTLIPEASYVSPGDLQPCNPAYFQSNYGVAIDRQGYVFVSDWVQHVIRRISPTGAVVTIAGQAGTSGHVDGPGAAAVFHAPKGMALGPKGALYVADSNNHVIRKITYVTKATCGASANYTGYCVTTVAGTAKVAGRADGVVGVGQLREPSDVVLDSAGRIYIADTQNHMIRLVNIPGTLLGYAGTGSSGKPDFSKRNQPFNQPQGIAMGPQGKALYISDTHNHIVRKIDLATKVESLVAGKADTGGYARGLGDKARFNEPVGLEFDTVGRLLVVDRGNSIIRTVSKLLTGEWDAQILAGTPRKTGEYDGVWSRARFDRIHQLAIDRHSTGPSLGRVVTADENRHTVRVYQNFSVSTLAGNSALKGLRSGRALCAAVTKVSGLALGKSGDLYLSVGNHNAIFRVDVKGRKMFRFAGYGANGKENAALLASSFNGPAGLAFDPSFSFLYVADSNNHAIRKIAMAAGQVSLVAGSGTKGFGDAVDPTKATFATPRSVAFDKQGNVYIADRDNHAIRKISTSGAVSTLAGSGSSGSTNGKGKAASFDTPGGIALDAQGNLYVTDLNNHQIRKIDPTGQVTRYAGTGQPGFRSDVLLASQFNIPFRILSLAKARMFLVSDSSNHRIRLLRANDAITFMGSGVRGVVNGTPAQVKLDTPKHMVVGLQGTFYLSDEMGLRSLASCP